MEPIGLTIVPKLITHILRPVQFKCAALTAENCHSPSLYKTLQEYYEK